MICLVCKSKIARDTYLCPDCNAFYCTKCKFALKNSENACWVCETPFDIDKPVNLKIVEPKVKVETVHKK